jgi:hypothetical protein
MKNTVTGLKAIIGKKFHSEDVQMEMQHAAYQIVDKVPAPRASAPPCLPPAAV